MIRLVKDLKCRPSCLAVFCSHSMQPLYVLLPVLVNFVRLLADPEDERGRARQVLPLHVSGRFLAGLVYLGAVQTAPVTAEVAHVIGHVVVVVIFCRAARTPGPRLALVMKLVMKQIFFALHTRFWRGFSCCAALSTRNKTDIFRTPNIY
jgi:hypothetical protein